MLPALSNCAARVPLSARPSTPVSEAVPLTLPERWPLAPSVSVPAPLLSATCAPSAATTAVPLLTARVQLRALPTWFSAISRLPPRLTGPKVMLPVSATCKAAALSPMDSGVTVSITTGALLQSSAAPLLASASPSVPSARLICSCEPTMLLTL